MRLLEVIARHGRDARARDVLASEGVTPFQSALSSNVLATSARPRETREPGTEFPLARERAEIRPDRHASAARWIAGLRHRSCVRPCRCAVAGTIDRSGRRSRSERGPCRGRQGAHDHRPHRRTRRPRLSPTPRDFGFVVRADDPRRYIVACAGAPICSSAHLAARAIAPLVAEIAGTQLDAAFNDPHFRLRQGLRPCGNGGAHRGWLARRMRAHRQRLVRMTLRSRAIATDQLPAAIAGFARDAKREAKCEKQPCLSARPICVTARRSMSARSPSSAPRPICRAFRRTKPKSRCA